MRANNYRQQKNETACSDKKISGTVETQSFDKILAQDIETDMQKYLALLVESEKSNVFFLSGKLGSFGLVPTSRNWTITDYPHPSKG